MANRLPVILMTPPVGASRAEKWMADGRQAATLDLIRVLSGLDGLGPVHILAADPHEREVYRAAGAAIVHAANEEFHFGQELAAFAESRTDSGLAYFGGASAPLLQGDLLEQALKTLFAVRGPGAVVNNFHSTDWMLLNSAAMLPDLAQRLPTDNPLGWVLEREAGVEVKALEPSAATRADLDTPTDLILLAGHRSLGMEMTHFLSRMPEALKLRVQALHDVLRAPGNTLIVIGRSSSSAWQQLERNTQIWVRLFVEERGMAASGRLERGEVRSLVAQRLEDIGPESFVEELAGLGDAVLWDTRVWMAHRGTFPAAADRFAADLGWADEIEDPALSRLTHAINQADIPIVTGGHGVVSGGVYALVERLSRDAATSP